MFILRLLLVVPAILLSGCGYGRTDPGGAPGGYTWGSVYRGNVASVAVPVFQTRVFSRGDEVALTQAIVNQLESRTPYKVAPRERADSILEGEIVAVEVTTVSQDPNTSLPQEQLYTLVIDFMWKDLRTGQILVERRNFDQASTHYPTLGEGRFVGRQSTVERLAAAVVDELQADW